MKLSKRFSHLSQRYYYRNPASKTGQRLAFLWLAASSAFTIHFLLTSVNLQQDILRLRRGEASFSADLAKHLTCGLRSASCRSHDPTSH